MTCFLLVARCYVDDVPLGIYATADEARAAAKCMTRRDLSVLAEVAGFPCDAEPISDDAIHIVEFTGGRPTGHEQNGSDGFRPPITIEGEARRVKPAVDELLIGIESDSAVESLLLAVADSVHDSAANVGEDSWPYAEDIRRLVAKWRSRGVPL
jgi:hypothetical protein